MRQLTVVIGYGFRAINLHRIPLFPCSSFGHDFIWDPFVTREILASSILLIVRTMWVSTANGREEQGLGDPLFCRFGQGSKQKRGGGGFMGVFSGDAPDIHPFCNNVLGHTYVMLTFHWYGIHARPLNEVGRSLSLSNAPY